MGISDLKSSTLHQLTLMLCIIGTLIVAGCSAPLQPAVTPTPAPQTIPPTIITSQVTTIPPASVSLFPSDVRPVGLAYQYKDSNGKQIVSVNVKSYKVQNQYNYFYNDVDTPNLVTVNGHPGYKFLFVGVTWDLIGLVGPGSRTTFLTPNTTSYRLINHGNVYLPLYPFTLTNPMHYYIKDQGTIVMAESIDKDNPGSGVLVFEVPGDVAAKDSYVEFCPLNEPYHIYEPHSPDNWDCESNTIRWKLV